MKFVTLSEEEFRKFANTHPLKTFLQTPEIGKLRKSNGWHTSYVGVKDKDKVLAACMLLSLEGFKKKLEFYSPRGPLLDYQNKELVSFFFTEVKKYIQEQNGFILRIDPYLVKQERNLHGDIVENGENNLDVIEQLKELGFQEKSDYEQVKWMFVLDTENKTPDDIMKAMKPNTRNCIRKGLKYGITLRDLSYDEIEEFKKITDETSHRIGFLDKPLSYYQDMYQLLHEKKEIRYVIAELNLDDYIKKLDDELKHIEKRLENIGNTNFKPGKKKTLEIDLINIQKKLTETKQLRKEKGEKIVLSGGMFICNCDEIIYLFSGNYDEYMQFNGQYIIQWEMIQYAIKNGFKRYNFYGISGDFDKSSSEYGVYEFKKGFGGYVVELIGEYELPINQYYHKFKRAQKIKSSIKKMLGK